MSTAPGRPRETILIEFAPEKGETENHLLIVKVKRLAEAIKPLLVASLDPSKAKDVKPLPLANRDWVGKELGGVPCTRDIPIKASELATASQQAAWLLKQMG